MTEKRATEIIKDNLCTMCDYGAECPRDSDKIAIDVDMLREIKLHNKESEDIKNA